jgi:hypothetical protein
MASCLGDWLFESWPGTRYSHRFIVTFSVISSNSSLTYVSSGTRIAQWYSAGLRDGWSGVRVPTGAGNFSIYHLFQTGSGVQSGCGSEEKNSQPLPRLKPPIIQPVAQCYPGSYINIWSPTLRTFTGLLSTAKNWITTHLIKYFLCQWVHVHVSTSNRIISFAAHVKITKVVAYIYIILLVPYWLVLVCTYPTISHMPSMLP